MNYTTLNAATEAAKNLGVHLKNLWYEDEPGSWDQKFIEGLYRDNEKTIMRLAELRDRVWHKQFA